jgi:hypothetical protein
VHRPFRQLAGAHRLSSYLVAAVAAGLQRAEPVEAVEADRLKVPLHQWSLRD